MNYYTLIKNNLKSLFTLKQVILLVFLMFIFIFSSTELIENANLKDSIYLISILNGSLNFTIQGKFIYILNQFIVISLFGNYLYLFIKYKLQYHIIRIGSVSRWYISLIITIFITIIIYYLSLIGISFIYALFFKNKIFLKVVNQLAQAYYKGTFINIIAINILNSVLYVLSNILLVVVIKNNILPYVILLIVQLVGIFLSIHIVDIAKLLPTAQTLVVTSCNILGIYIYLITFIFVIIFILNKYIQNNLFNIINIKTS